jgi:serine/threonine-protein kinase
MSDETSGRWQRVEDVVSEALEHEPSKRAAFLDVACAGDRQLRREAESLIDAHDRTGPLDALAAEVAPLFGRARESDSMQVAPERVGRYTIGGRVSDGGMGVVYHAVDEELGRTVALKFLQARYRADDSAGKRFRREARIVAALEHPNICTVHEIGESEDGRLYIAMPLYDGETLEQRIDRGPLTVDDAVQIAVQVARGLAKAHTAGIVHRDVKPSNIFITTDGVVKLLDFGIAKLADPALTATGATGPLGTVAYMSPEQARGEAVDARSDIWSLGVVLYEMLAGRRPFTGDAPAVVLDAIQRGRYVPIAALRPDIHPALARTVESALSKEPAVRQQSAQALERDLLAPRATPRAFRWRRGGVAVVAVVALGGVAATIVTSDRLPRRGVEIAATTMGDPAPTPARSMAVLPFVDLSGGGEADRYFGDGLSEEITTALGRIEGLRVAARTSTFALRDRALDVRRIGDTLGVDAVLEGSVRRAGHRLRVTTQLVDAHSGMRIWAGAYDREDADVLTVQDEIASAIADALELRLRVHEGTPRVRSTTNPEAYDLYLRALQLRTDLNADALQRATDLLDRAIELEPDFALAYAAKASVLEPRVLFRQIPQAEGLRAARAAIDRAFALDPRNGEAHVAQGILQLFWEWDWAGAERSLRRAVELDPNNPHAWHHLGNYYRAMGRLDDAADARLRGLALDPLNARLRAALGEEYFYGGRWDDALAALQRAAQIDPLHPILLGRANAAVGPGRVYIAEGREADGVRDLLRVAALRGAGADEVDALRAAYRTGGIHGFWRAWLEMDRRQSGSSIDPWRVAALSGLAGDSAQALSALERAYAERNPGLIFIRTDPSFASLRANPRYLRIVRAMKFPTR